MRTRLYGHISTASAVLCTVGAIYAFLHVTWWVAALSLNAGFFFAGNAQRCYRLARREGAVQQRLERLNREDDDARFVPPPPCCSFWRHTDHQVHGPDCTRPPAARTSLTPAERSAFAKITRAFHQTGGAA